MKMLLFILLLVGSFSFDHGVSGVDTDTPVSVSVMEGDSVTLHTGVVKTQQDRIRWYCNDTRIAQINGDLSKTCTDVQCNEGNERFRGRLKLDHLTGSLTIMNIRTEDSGLYKLKIISDSSISEKIFIFSVHGSVLMPVSVGVICAVAVLMSVAVAVAVGVAVGVVFYRRRRSTNAEAEKSKLEQLLKV
ncbi:unnamed protein product [Leuciscus chuanchicus]